MKYKAKCTKCETMIRTLYRKPITVQDSKDTYIEVRTEKEADLIETINNATGVINEKFAELTLLLFKKTYKGNGS